MNTVHPLSSHPEIVEVLKWLVIMLLGVVAYFVGKWYERTMGSGSSDEKMRNEGIEKIWPEVSEKMEELMAKNGTLQGLIEAKLETTEEKVTLMGSDVKEIQKSIVPKDECENRHASQGVKIDVILHELKQQRKDAQERSRKNEINWDNVRDFGIIMGKALLVLCKMQDQDCDDVKMMVDTLNKMKMSRMEETRG